jgi:thiol:disulfide interchange protein DsbC
MRHRYFLQVIQGGSRGRRIMKRGLDRAVLVALIGAISWNAVAAAESTARAADLAALKTKLEQRFPDAKIQSVAPSTIAGVYEIVSANLIVYSDITGEFVLMGPMIRSLDRVNVTEERQGELNGVPFDSLPLQLAMKTVKGSGSRQLAVFADPLCPYCQELEKTLEGVTDVTIHTFLLPLEDLHPGATLKAREIWCATDPARAWGEWMLRDQKPTAAAQCPEDPMPQILQLAKQHRFNSTPTIVFANGTRMAGALPAVQLERLLNAPRRQ